MIQVFKNLFVGGDDDYEKVKSDQGYAIVRACKYGPGGHQDILKYDSHAAPKGPNYLAARRGRVLALNFVDSDNPDFIPQAMVDEALKFISEQLGAEKRVLVACNAGASRAPTLAFLWLFSQGKLSPTYSGAIRMFRKLYPKYDPALGADIYARRRVQEMKHR